MDYEAITLYNLTIRGSFNNEYYSEKTITVQVIDQNDNPPETTPTNLTFQLSENSSTLTEIAFDLGFHDADSGINAIIKTAVILDSIANEYFQINTSGEVTNIIILQWVWSPHFSLIIETILFSPYKDKIINRK